MTGRCFRDLARDKAGVAAVEMAIVSTFVLVPLLGGFISFSQALELQARLDRGVHVAMIDAWGQPTLTTATSPTLSTEMTSAVAKGYGTGTAPTVVATAAWYCISPTGTKATGTLATQTTTCTAPQILGKWVAVTATVTFTPIMKTITFANTMNGVVSLNSISTVRVQ